VTYRDDSASVRAENARLRAELATASAATPRRYAMRPGDYLAAPIIIGGYPMGVLLAVVCIRLALPLWAGGAALALGCAWWALALRWCSGGGR